MTEKIHMNNKELEDAINVIRADGGSLPLVHGEGVILVAINDTKNFVFVNTKTSFNNALVLLEKLQGIIESIEAKMVEQMRELKLRDTNETKK